MIKNMPTSWKIGFTMGIIIAGIIFLGIFSLKSSSSINKRVVNLYTQELKPLIALNSVKGAMYRFRDRTLRYILEAGDKDAYRHLEHLEEQEKRVIEEISRYKSTRLSKEEENYLKNFEEKWQIFAKIVKDEVIPAVKKEIGGGVKADEIFFKKALPVFREARDNLNALIEYQEKRAHKRYRNANKIYSNVINTTWTVIITIVLLSAILAFNLLKSIRTPLSEIQSSMKTLSQGSLTIKTKYNSKDEFGQTLSMLNEALESLNSAIKEAKQVANENSNISDELATTAHHVSNNVEEMAKSVQVIKGEGEATINRINEITEGIVNAKELIENANRELIETKDKMDEVGEKVKLIAKNELDLAKRIERLEDHSKEVGSIVKIIADIAEQTNILALNAAIEAARAGESGRGFAVVAEEVRKLAQKIQNSLSNIEEILNTMVVSVSQIADQMRKNSEAIMELSKFSQEVVNKFEVMSRSIHTANESYEDIVHGFIENKAAMEKVINQIKEIDLLAEANAKSVEEIAAATEQLRNITVDLNRKLDKFTTTN